MNTHPIWYQTRPSADRLGNAYHRHGSLQPMPSERVGLLARLFGRVGHG
jgi:hypothetical protein